MRLGQKVRRLGEGRGARLCGAQRGRNEDADARLGDDRCERCRGRDGGGMPRSIDHRAEVHAVAAR